MKTREIAETVAEYRYDGLNRRIAKSTDDEGVLSENRHYFLNGQNQVLEEDVEASPIPNPESLIPVYQYVWSPRYIDAPICRDEFSGGVIQPGSRLYYLGDANYNVTALVNTSGDVVERYVYDAYGKVTVCAATDWSVLGTASTVGNTTLYTGRELDMETGLQYSRARYYSADLGRFVSRDPIEDVDGTNLYRYMDDAPIDGSDPTGWRPGLCTSVTFDGYGNARLL